MLSASAFAQPDKPKTGTGWHDGHKEVKTKKYGMSTVISHNPSMPKEAIRPYLETEFANLFAKKFIEDGIIQIQERVQANPFDRVYDAEMNVAQGSISTLVLPSKMFFAHDQEWSERDIIEALKETFPERLL